LCKINNYYLNFFKIKEGCSKFEQPSIKLNLNYEKNFIFKL
jgi:hypothetical protein